MIVSVLPRSRVMEIGCVDEGEELVWLREKRKRGRDGGMRGF